VSYVWATIMPRRTAPSIASVACCTLLVSGLYQTITYLLIFPSLPSHFVPNHDQPSPNILFIKVTPPPCLTTPLFFPSPPPFSPSLLHLVPLPSYPNPFPTFPLAVPYPPLPLLYPFPPLPLPLNMGLGVSPMEIFFDILNGRP
jgi:hypothetical protein